MDELEEGLAQEEQVEAAEVEETPAEQPSFEGVSTSEVEELKRQIKGLDRAASKHKAELEQARAQGNSIEAIKAQQEETKAMLQDFQALLKGEEVETQKPISAYDRLMQERAARPVSQSQQPQYNQEAASEVRGLIKLRDWEVDNPDVQKAIKMGTPEEALDYLKSVAKKEDEKAIGDKVSLEIQKQLKAHGLTGGGAGTPNIQGTKTLKVGDFRKAVDEAKTPQEVLARFERK